MILRSCLLVNKDENECRMVLVSEFQHCGHVVRQAHFAWAIIRSSFANGDQRYFGRESTDSLDTFKDAPADWSHDYPQTSYPQNEGCDWNDIKYEGSVGPPLQVENQQAIEETRRKNEEAGKAEKELQKMRDEAKRTAVEERKKTEAVMRKEIEVQKKYEEINRKEDKLREYAEKTRRLQLEANEMAKQARLKADK